MRMIILRIGDLAEIREAGIYQGFLCRISAYGGLQLVAPELSMGVGSLLCVKWPSMQTPLDSPCSGTGSPLSVPFRKPHCPKIGQTTAFDKLQTPACIIDIQSNGASSTGNNLTT